MQRLWKRWRWALRALLYILTALSTAYVIVDASRDHDNPPGYDHGHLLIPAAIILSLSYIFDIFDGVLRKARRDQDSELGRTIDKHLYTLHGSISKLNAKRKKLKQDHASQRTLRDMGLTVWLVPRYYLDLSETALASRAPKWVRRRAQTTELWRAARFRSSGDLTPTEIRWTKGRGAIGICWQERAAEGYNLVQLWPSIELPAAEWKSAFEQKEESVKMGLSGGEAYRLRNNYGAVRVVPIRVHRATSSRSIFYGCLSIDTPSASSDLSLDDPKLVSIISRASQQIGKELQKAQR